MAAYSSERRLEGFEGSCHRFEALASKLGEPASEQLEHAELEELVGKEGRELLRSLLQDHLSLRAAREVPAAISSRTAWTSPAPAGAFTAQKLSFACVPCGRATISTRTGLSTCNANGSETTSLRTNAPPKRAAPNELSAGCTSLI